MLLPSPSGSKQIPRFSIALTSLVILCTLATGAEREEWVGWTWSGLLVRVLCGAVVLTAAGIWVAGASTPSGYCSCPRIRALRRVRVAGIMSGEAVACSTEWDASNGPPSSCPRIQALRRSYWIEDVLWMRLRSLTREGCPIWACW
jgi:hypothetical protein